MLGGMRFRKIMGLMHKGNTKQGLYRSDQIKNSLSTQSFILLHFMTVKRNASFKIEKPEYFSKMVSNMEGFFKKSSRKNIKEIA